MLSASLFKSTIADVKLLTNNFALFYDNLFAKLQKQDCLKQQSKQQRPYRVFILENGYPISVFMYRVQPGTSMNL